QILLDVEEPVTVGVARHGDGVGPVAVLVAPVAGDVERAGVDLRVVVVAVQAGVRPGGGPIVAVAVHIGQVDAVVVLVDAVVGDLGRAGVDRRIVVIAVVAVVVGAAPVVVVAVPVVAQVVEPRVEVE